jgi:hypothetical protein
MENLTASERPVSVLKRKKKTDTTPEKKSDVKKGEGVKGERANDEKGK